MVTFARVSNPKIEISSSGTRCGQDTEKGHAKHAQDATIVFDPKTRLFNARLSLGFCKSSRLQIRYHSLLYKLF
jgi:hypothetical protein